MKVWKSFGSEHSLNLELIGKFKTSGEAEHFKKQFEGLTELLLEQERQGTFSFNADRYPKPILDYLSSKKLSFLPPQLLTQFMFEISLSVNGNEIRVTSDDELCGLVSLLVQEGAKVEVFSVHNYPESEVGGESSA